MNKNTEIFLTFLKIGAMTFGGGYAMIANVEEEIVEKKKWISKEELINVIAIAESTPGPIAINMATYVGYKKNKLLGAIIATLGVVLPSFLIILALSCFFNALIDKPIVSKAFVGIKIAVGYLIVRSGFKLLKEFNLKCWQIILFLFIFLAGLSIELLGLSVSIVWLIIAGGLIGYLISLFLSIRRKVK